MPIRVRDIEWDSDAYGETLDLREGVLRTPLWTRLREEDIAGEDHQIHLAAYDKQTLVGCVVLKPIDGNRLKLRQMAVDPARQRQGIGTSLVRAAIETARDLGFDGIEMDARASAEAFYRRLGFKPHGERYDIIGIEHIRMTQTV